MLESGSVTTRPLRLLKPGRHLPILSGRLLGKKWILEAGERSCWLGTYQKEVQALFSKLISPGDVVFEIGGRVGFLALLASKLVGRQGQVIVFEPQPRALAYLHKHLALNRARNVTVVEAAVSYKNTPPTDADLPRGEAGSFPAGGPLYARSCTLDGLFARGQVPPPDLIHMDIGGGEFAALCGARTLLTRAHPAILLSTHTQDSHRECCAFLEMLDYRLAPLDGKALEESRQILATHI